MSDRVKVLCGPVRRRVSRAVWTETSVSWVPDGEREAEVELWIDVALLDTLGVRAMRNKNRRAVLAGGEVEARVVSPIRRVEAT
jgi:hypothetical protein